MVALDGSGPSKVAFYTALYMMKDPSKDSLFLVTVCPKLGDPQVEKENRDILQYYANISALRGIDYHCIFGISTDPALLVCHQAMKKKINFLLAGNRGAAKEGKSNFSLGSFAKFIVENAPCSVHIIKDNWTSDEQKFEDDFLKESRGIPKKDEPLQKSKNVEFVEVKPTLRGPSRDIPIKDDLQSSGNVPIYLNEKRRSQMIPISEGKEESKLPLRSVRVPGQSNIVIARVTSIEKELARQKNKDQIQSEEHVERNQVIRMEEEERNRRINEEKMLAEEHVNRKDVIKAEEKERMRRINEDQTLAEEHANRRDVIRAEEKERMRRIKEDQQLKERLKKRYSFQDEIIRRKKDSTEVKSPRPKTPPPTTSASSDEISGIRSVLKQHLDALTKDVEMLSRIKEQGFITEGMIANIQNIKSTIGESSS